MTTTTRLLTRLLSTIHRTRPTLHTTRRASIFIFFTCHLLTQQIGYITVTSGPSMLPTLSVNGDAVLLSRYHRRGRGVKVGDLVTFRHPLEPEEGALKRVVGMPGDFVCTGQRVRGREGEEGGMIQVCGLVWGFGGGRG